MDIGVLLALIFLVVVVIFAAASATKAKPDSSSRPKWSAGSSEPFERAEPPVARQPKLADHSDTLWRSDFLPHGEELPYFREDRRVRLLEVADWLVMVTDDGKMVNPRSTQLYKVGIFSFGIRGTSYYEDTVTQGDFSPGASLNLVREPANEHDPNAVAIYAPGVPSKVGYVNKLNAKRIAPLLDNGADLVCISLRGDGPGQFGIVPHVLVTNRVVLQKLTA